MKHVLFVLLLAAMTAGCATTKKENHCPVAVVEVSQPNAGNVGHK